MRILSHYAEGRLDIQAKLYCSWKKKSKMLYLPTRESSMSEGLIPPGKQAALIFKDATISLQVSQLILN